MSEKFLYNKYFSLGNHEFDEPVDTGLVPFIKNLSAPVLAANLILDKEPELKAENNLFKSIILTKNGVKIGIIGYLTPETKYLAPKNNVEFEDEVPAIRKEVKKLKQNNVNILIALGHSGFIKDLQIARDVEDLDLVIGGHSNTFLWNNNSTSEKPEIPEGLYPVEVKQANGRIVRVVQAYAYTKYMGQLHLIFNSNGEIIQCDGNPLLLDQNVPRDAELLKTVNKYRADISRIENEVVGSSYVTLYGHHSCRTKECNMGDLVTDAILNYTNTQYRDEYPDVTQAIIQGGRFRASISHPNIPFDVTRGDLMTVFPFSDSLSLITMNGKVLKQSLEHSVSTWRTVDSTGQFQQFSGMKVVYDLARPVGTRVVKASAVCVTCGGKMEDIEDEYEYNIMMPTFLGNGGDGYTMFEKLAKVTIPYGELESLLYYLAQYGPVSTQLDGRIMILNEDKVLNYLDTDAKIEARRPETSDGNTIDSIKLFYIMIAVILCIESN